MIDAGQPQKEKSSERKRTEQKCLETRIYFTHLRGLSFCSLRRRKRISEISSICLPQNQRSLA